MKMFLFTTGSMLTNLKLRTAEDCQAYLKPGVKLEELDEDLNSSCGCNFGPPIECTGLDIRKVDGKLICGASEDCQKVIQEMVEAWIEKPPITNIECISFFRSTKLFSYLYLLG